MKRIGVIAGILALFFAVTPKVGALSADRGLLITPPRQFLTIDPGKTTKSSITIANLTEKPMDVSLSVEHFSVADYTYSYMFDLPKEDWVHFEQTEVTLKKSESRTISYTVVAPADAAPGGHYFTLFASTSLVEGEKVRAATVLYITASGELSKESSIVQSSIPWISFGGDIPFSLDAKNTGNTHFVAYTSGVMKGILPFPGSPPNEVAHVLLPNTTRTVEETMPAPLLPGVYQAAIGYRDEDGHDTRRVQYSLYVPPWSIALVVGSIWLGILLFKRRKQPTDS
ncbi:MAG TPA: hypothetical protein VFH06_00710 [Candidatus Saccharimonadales bacterium]|nr:hypothetical protein [Candidatus Saccharimonadales bacterium]